MSKANFNSVSQKSSAWVVFSGQTERWWLRFLRPGFRHCLLVMYDGRHWLSIDPMLNYMSVQVHHTVPEEFDFPRWLQSQGQHVVRAPIDHSKAVPAPLMLMSCVEVVKRVLGIHHRRVLTPWQLYRYLTKHQKTKH